MKKTLTKADIVERIYESTDKNRVDVKNVVEKLLEIMKNAIKKDNALLISGFGKFEAYDKASRKGRNPQTDEAITLPPRKVVVFRRNGIQHSRLNDAGQGQAAGEVVGVHRADHVLPDEGHRIVCLIP